MLQPNLFAYATSELSQDAVLCWMLAWGAPELADVDGQIHGLGRSFLRALFGAAGVAYPSELQRIVVERQFEKVDVVARIDDTHIVIIEDKTVTREHSGQLKRYREAVSKREPQRTQVRVYVTTGDQDGYEHLHNQGWGVLRRLQLLEFLRSVQSSNAIFTDFRDHLERIESSVQAFRTKPGGAWDSAAWKGFFTSLREQLGKGWWNYVANPSGGFMGFWWGHVAVDGGHVYLQLEEGKLVVKIDVADKARRRELRDRWVGSLVGGELKRPERLGSGRWVTIAEYGEYRVWRDGRLDLEATAEMLRSATNAVHELVSPAVIAAKEQTLHHAGR